MASFKNVSYTDRVERARALIKKNKNSNLSVFLTSPRAVKNWHRVSWLILKAIKARSKKNKTEYLNQISSSEFERFCAYLLILEGYRPEFVNKSNASEFDGGIDAVLVKDKVRIFVQCKKQNAPNMQGSTGDYPIITVTTENVKKFTLSTKHPAIESEFRKKEVDGEYDFHFLYATLGTFDADVYTTFKKDSTGKAKLASDGFVRLWELRSFKKIPKVIEMANNYEHNLVKHLDPIRIACMFIGLTFGFLFVRLFTPFSLIIHIIFIMAAMFGLAVVITKKTTLAVELTTALLMAQIFFLAILLVK